MTALDANWFACYEFESKCRVACDRGFGGPLAGHVQRGLPPVVPRKPAPGGRMGGAAQTAKGVVSSGISGRLVGKNTA